MKKRVILCIGIALLVVLCACGSKNEPAAAPAAEEAPVPTSQSFGAAAEPQQPQEPETPAEPEAPLQTGWIYDGLGWHWVYDDGTEATSCWEWIEGAWYYFTDNGYTLMDTWFDDPDDGLRYWLKDDGAAAMNETLLIDGVEYTFDSHCHIVEDGAPAAEEAPAEGELPPEGAAPAGEEAPAEG